MSEAQRQALETMVEFDCPMSQKIRQDVSREKDFEVTDVEVRMRGCCPKCRQKKR